MKIIKPTLLVNESVCRNNILEMVLKARNAGVSFRPHMKTHQSLEVGQWYKEAGVDSITASSVDMARFFADAGWKDITIAFPYNLLEWEEIESLAKRIQLNVLIESKEALDHLNKYIKAPLGYLLKIDLGTHRTGIDPGNVRLIHATINSSNPDHRLIGLLGHAGHSYQTGMDKKKADKIFKTSLESFNKVKSEVGRTDLVISYGDTPTCSLLEEFPGITEIRPGNFVFYDLMQYAFGSCNFSDIGVCMACPVVAVHPERGEIVIFGGAVHFSKDFVNVNGKRNYGLVVKLTEDGWEAMGNSYVTKLSQEHGIITAGSALLEDTKVGDLLGIIPIHSCLAADAIGEYFTLEGKQIKMRSKVR